jgi:glycolate oxidase FAD binding subunit
MADIAGTAPLQRLLQDALPAEALDADAARYAIDGVQPALAARPANASEVTAALVAANEAGAAVVPWGSGSQQDLGMPPRRYDLALDLSRLDRVVEYEPADLTVTVEAGVRLGDLQRALGEHGQWLPLSAPLASGATVGGVLATNASGPERYRYGTARDLLIGIGFVLPDGTLAKSGGRVVKNVAGYDLGKLQIGALGSVGVIVQATFKVAPLPARRQTQRVEGTLPGLMSITRAVGDKLLAALAVVISGPSPQGRWRLEVEFAGGAAAVQRSLQELETLAAASGLQAAQAAGGVPAAQPEDRLRVRASVQPSASSACCERLAGLDASVVAYPEAGIVYGAWRDAGAVDGATLQALRRFCVESGRGAFVLERAPAVLKRGIGVWGDPPPSFEVMRRLKGELDPRAILNPGRFVGGI